VSFSIQQERGGRSTKDRRRPSLLDVDFEAVRDDPEALRMERDLLAVQHELLRERASNAIPRAEVDTALQRVREQERAKGREALERLRTKHDADTAERRARFASVPHERLAVLRRDQQDLRAILHALRSSRSGRLLARWPPLASLLRKRGGD
jgi:hypothetical protein